MRSESSPQGTAARAATSGVTARALVRRTRHITHRQFPAEDQIRILLEGIRAERSVAERCRREAFHPTVSYYWLKGVMEAGKARVRGTRSGTPRRPRWGISGRSRSVSRKAWPISACRT
jgi:transposase-like protein